ncbi:MAG: hypothetical protein KDJ97_20340 [Anaerolineae bacterium]|nr:hypothetical protein [Anaerolineae bacterium]
MPYRWIDPELFLEFAGVAVYHCYEDEGPVSYYWYTTDPQDDDRVWGHPDSAQFDVRTLPDLGLDVKDFETHAAIIRQAIQAGLISGEPGVVEEPPLVVKIGVKGGVVYVVEKLAQIEVEILDHDVDREQNRRKIMTYDGKFRDFMVGWIAAQLNEPGRNRAALENLYEEVVDAENDARALLRVGQILGQEMAQRLWGLSEQWHDPTVEQARPMIEVLRQQVQEEEQDQTQFYRFFLNPFEDNCVPRGFEDSLEQTICWMFRLFYRAVGEAVLAPLGWEASVVVEPYHEDASTIVILAHPQADSMSKVFVNQIGYKVWRLRFDRLSELAEELLRQRQAIERAAHQAIGGYHLAQTAIEVMGERAATVMARFKN